MQSLDSLISQLPSLMEAIRNNNFGLLSLGMLVVAVVAVLLLKQSPVWTRLVAVFMVLFSAVSLCLVSLASNTSISQKRVSTVEVNLDRKRGDYMNFYLTVESQGNCREICIQDNRCKAWTLVMPPQQHPDLVKCWLKDVITEPVSVDGRTSGVISEIATK